MADAAAGMNPRGLAVVGELCVDLVVGLSDQPIRFGQHEQIVPFTTLTMGSSSAITACGAAALNVPTTMVGVRGDDEFGSYIDRELRARGVDVSSVRIDPSTPTGSSTHLTRPDGDRAILTAMGSIGRTRASDVTDSVIHGAAHLHCGSYFLQESLWPDAAALYERARKAGLSTSLDGNFDPTERWDNGILDVLAHCDVFFGNEQELRGITGADDIDDAVESVLDRMPKGAIVVCKLGADGASAMWRERGASRRISAATPDAPGELVDTVGAGDSLAAGFIAARLTGGTVENCLALGVACGTASTRGPGGVGAQPSRTAADAVAASVRLSTDA
ncbi:carbohydrate kinase family protein [Microbacterium hominis]|uniref:Carbohydrate kinase family protein n=1 Tax=Microbacterium hominis TaxID=162426 RepID=A0A7D4UAA9_9MICO|nr:carbohydrate kinase family protein [Microbacterium hominis]QKJ18263.1 carbohydrate kinase family protein [Microbacterium hominis]